MDPGGYSRRDKQAGSVTHLEAGGNSAPVEAIPLPVRVLAPAPDRQRLEAVLAGLPGFRVTEGWPAVVLLSGTDWPRSLARLRGEQPEREPAAVLAATLGPEQLASGSRQGIRGFVAVEDPPELLGAALRAVAAGQAFCSPALLSHLVSGLCQGLRDTPAREPGLPDPLARKPAPSSRGGKEGAPPAPDRLLSARQLRVARAVVRGLSNQEVAGELGLSPATVKFHLRQIYGRLGIRRRSQLAALLLRLPGA